MFVDNNQSDRMTLVELLGCVLVTFGPPAAMFVVTVARSPLRVILLMARYEK